MTVWRRTQIVLWLAAAGAMAACHPGHGPPPVSGEGYPKGFSRAETQSYEAGRLSPQEDHAHSSEGRETQTARRTPQPDTPPEVDADPERFIGLSDAEVLTELGRPGQFRSEADAKVLQYRNEDCVLDLVLYPADKVPRVVFMEARDRKGRTAQVQTCLRQLLIQRAATRTG